MIETCKELKVSHNDKRGYTSLYPLLRVIYFEKVSK